MIRTEPIREGAASTGRDMPALMSVGTDRVPAQAKPFDYSVLSPEQASEAREAVSFIGERRQATTNAIIEIGARLIDVKASLGHGHFLRWLEAECGWSERSAQNYMNASNAFGLKSETVADLPVTTVYELARVSEPVRSRVIEQMQAEQLPVERVRDLIAEEKAKERQAAADAKKTVEQRQKEKAKRARQEKARERDRQAWDAAQKEREISEQLRQEAARHAARLIVARFGRDHLPELQSALEAAGYEAGNLVRWINHAASMAPETI